MLFFEFFVVEKNQASEEKSGENKSGELKTLSGVVNRRIPQFIKPSAFSAKVHAVG